MSAPTPPELSVILPTYNERESLPRVVEEIHAILRRIPHEILVVDDNSPDGTWRWVEEASARDPSLRLIRRMANPGLSAAVLDGFRAAVSDHWIVMDADGQHDPSILPAIHEGLKTYELIAPSRYAQGGGTGRWTLTRWLGSRLATWLAQLILNVPLSDPMSGYFGIRREAYQPIASRMNPRGFKILLEVYYRLSRRTASSPVAYCELPYRFRSRFAGESKLSGRIIRQYLQQLLALRQEAPWPEGLPKFLFVGAMGTAVNCAALSVLVHRAGWHYLLASTAAIQLSILHNFLWHDRWTFKDRRTRYPWWVRGWHYELTALAGMAVNWTALAVLVEWADQPLLIANCFGIAMGTALNFAMSKLWTWKRQPVPTEAISQKVRSVEFGVRSQ